MGNLCKCGIEPPGYISNGISYAFCKNMVTIGLGIGVIYISIGRRSFSLI